jgi:hypothetical protein
MKNEKSNCEICGKSINPIRDKKSHKKDKNPQNKESKELRSYFHKKCLERTKVSYGRGGEYF